MYYSKIFPTQSSSNAKEANTRIGRISKTTMKPSATPLSCWVGGAARGLSMGFARR